MALKPEPLTDLAGRVGFVTGGTRGIGLATARLLASRGANLAVAAHTDQGVAESVARSLAEEFNVEALGLACDSTLPDEISLSYRAIRDRFGRLDFLVNNAGVLDAAPIGMISGEVVAQTLSVNAGGQILHLQAAARLMRRTGGSIVNITSIMGVEGAAGYVVYSASKAAVIGLTRSAAKELAPRGIRVNAIAPGVIATDMTAALEPKALTETLATVKMGRIGTAEDVAHVVLFLVSDLSSYVTGQVIGVDGGMLI